ncbi:MAG: IS110 family transposase [Kiritimatiellae bacterium]|nr:IS110 family transposase [Kiritimatiellia bacterium]
MDLQMNIMQPLYGGLDLHGNNVFCSLVDTARKIVAEIRLPNDIARIREWLNPYKARLSSLAVESTYNWYWLVDGLSEEGFDVRLANPAKMEENIGLKDANDKTDARFLARQLSFGILPEGYIYPKEARGVRDKMRQRLRMVQCRTAELLSLEGLVARHTGRHLNAKGLGGDEVSAVLEGHPEAANMAARTLRHVEFLDAEIKALGKEILEELPGRQDYELLMTMPGVGFVLARTILLETGDIGRFQKAGNYASYCRAVKSSHTSNGKKKGDGNPRNGNRYLAWAFVEAANFARRASPEINAWAQRKEARSGKHVIAVKALANKLAKAAYFIMKNKEPFDLKRIL